MSSTAALSTVGLLTGALLLAAAGAARAETDREYCERQEGSAKVVCLRNLDRKQSSPSSSAPAPAAAPSPAAAATPATPTAAAPAAASGDAPYKVVDGDHVDARTLEGFRTWRAAACDRCHGPNQEGMVGPSLIASLKVLTKDQFKTTVTEGRLEKGMPAFKTNDKVVQNMDALYAYLKGRSDGAITKAHVKPME